MYEPTISAIKTASNHIYKFIVKTPFEHNLNISRKINANVFLKREDLTPVRSYKIRGAINKLTSLYDESKNIRQIVTCSAGNHAQGVAYICNKMKIQGKIFMPVITTDQKKNKVANFGGDYVDIVLIGDNFDESYDNAKKFSIDNKIPFVHPFDDEKVIEGQATVGLEILESAPSPIDYIFLPIGGGGLSAGVSSYIKHFSPSTKIIGVQPLGAPSMLEAFKHNKIIKLTDINSFVDGASVKRSGELNFPICKKNLDDIILIDEGHVCQKIVEMYNDNGIIIEPAGVLSLCALDIMKGQLEGKTIVSIISGGNSDAFRMSEILERSLIYGNKRHYFKIEFPQKPGTLKDFVIKILGHHDDIFYFRYTKVINKEHGPVIVGIEVKDPNDINSIKNNMTNLGFKFEKISNVDLF